MKKLKIISRVNLPVTNPLIPFITILNWYWIQDISHISWLYVFTLVFFAIWFLYYVFEYAFGKTIDIFKILKKKGYDTDINAEPFRLLDPDKIAKALRDSAFFKSINAKKIHITNLGSGRFKLFLENSVIIEVSQSELDYFVNHYQQLNYTIINNEKKD